MPTENPTGDHLRVFDLPAHWPRGGGDGAVLRFDGVESCARVWLNGTEPGTFKGSRLAHEFAVGPLLRPAGNVPAVRVHRWSAGSYPEDQDQWWLPGIFRDVTLLHRPAGGVRDFFVHASYDHRTGTGTLRVDSDVDGRVTVPDLGVDVPTGEPVTVPVRPWSAEVPRLYDGVPATGGERVPLRIGFRTVEVADGLLTVNGRPVLFKSASGWRRPRPTVCAGSAAVPGRRTRTPGRPPWWGAGSPRWTSCRRRTSVRRRTAPGSTSVGPSWADCGSRATRSSS
ncbi:hypothetical protein Shyhy01_05980 [Streptomyces hygroscopicus subsp. hygroscopicus]|nr:hypothetical protein Shyhy01_05980 [Streptomyces hygroscopicus subsp. hygroscopicus]